MSEPIIADFVGKFNAQGMARAEPTPGRVLLSKKRLVLAAREDEKLTIPLSSIIDIAVGHVPPDLGEFFDSTVTVAYERGNGGRVAAIEGSDENITRFSNVLFKAILNGTDATVKDRATVGGWVTDAEFAPASVSVSPGTISFRRDGESFAFELESVVDFQRTTHRVAGRSCPVLAVRHRDGKTTVRTLVATGDSRRLSLLGRYIRMEFSDVVRDVQELELSETDRRSLVALYTTNDLEDRDLARLLDVNRSDLAAMRQTLASCGALQDDESDEGDGDDGPPKLTRAGEVVVMQYARESAE